MLVGTQKLAPGTFNRYLVARAHKKAARKRNMILGLSLTSMVDMFSLLVIFLLQTFSTSPEMLAIAKGVTLPNASTSQEIKDAPLISIATDGIYLDQKFVGKTESVLKEPTPLMEKLEGLKKVWMDMHPSESFKGEINLQADREMPSTVISQVMAMLATQSYGSVQLAVIAGGSAN